MECITVIITLVRTAWTKWKYPSTLLYAVVIYSIGRASVGSNLIDLDI